MEDVPLPNQYEGEDLVGERPEGESEISDEAETEGGEEEETEPVLSRAGWYEHVARGHTYRIVWSHSSKTPHRSPHQRPGPYGFLFLRFSSVLDSGRGLNQNAHGRCHGTRSRRERACGESHVELRSWYDGYKQLDVMSDGEPSLLSLVRAAARQEKTPGVNYLTAAPGRHQQNGIVERGSSNFSARRSTEPLSLISFVLLVLGVARSFGGSLVNPGPHTISKMLLICLVDPGPHTMPNTLLV